MVVLETEIIQKLSEYLHCKSLYPDLPVLLHNYEIDVQAKKLISEQTETLPPLGDTEKNFLLDFAKFLTICKTSQGKENFLNYCKSPLSPSQRTELQNRIADIEKNPNIGVSWEDAIQRIESRIGKKITLTSGS